MVTTMKARNRRRGAGDVGRETEGMFARGPQSISVGDPTEFREALLGKRTNGKAKNENVAKVTVGRVDQAVVVPKTIAVALIAPSPWQPRTDFPEAELREFAASIATQGQLHPIAVRVAPGHSPAKPAYELVDGERRLRAAKLLGWKEIRAEVGEYSDAQVRAIVLATALQRKELNAIEEARAFRAAIDAGDAAGSTELAKQLGLSQGHVSNRLRLLELPSNVQAAVISREISPTNARTLATLKDAPAVLDSVVKKTAGKDLNDKDFDHEIRSALRTKCRTIERGTTYDFTTHRHFPSLPLSAEQRDELRIVKHGSFNGKPAEYATNVKLFDQLWKDHKKAVIAGEAKREKKADATPAKKLTPAQAVAKEKEKAAQFSRRLYEWKENWMRHLIAEHLRHAADIAQITRVAMLALTKWHHRLSIDDLEEVVDKSIGWKDGMGVTAVFSIQDFDLDKQAGRLAAKIFFDAEGGPCPAVSGRDLEVLAESLEIDLALEWSNHQAGPLSEGYWRLHTKDQLIELAGELKAGFDDQVLRGTKEQLVAAFVARIPKDEDKEAGLPLPKEIKKAKGGK